MTWINAMLLDIIVIEMVVAFFIGRDERRKGDE